MLVCSPTGMIYFLSGSFPGSKNDIGVYKIFENQFHCILDEDEAICGDAGYQGLQNFHLSVIPFSGIYIYLYLFHKD